MNLKDSIRSIKDFPEEGIIFRDITTLLKDPAALKQAVDEIDQKLADVDYDIIVAPESRGFIFGMPLAYLRGKGFVPIRKKGKLPAETVSREYALEYGTATIEMHVDAVKKGQKVVIIDDLLATGGTMKAAYDLVKKFNPKKVYVNFIIELTREGLNGRDNFDKDTEITTLLEV